MIGRNRGRATYALRLVEGGAELPVVEGSGSDDWSPGRTSPHGMTVELREHPGDIRGQMLRGAYRCDKGEYAIGTWLPTGRYR